MRELSAEIKTELRESVAGLERNLTSVRRLYQVCAALYGFVASLFLRAGMPSLGLLTKGAPRENLYLGALISVLVTISIWLCHLRMYNKKYAHSLATIKDAKKHLGK